MTTRRASPYMTPAQVRSMTPMTGSTRSEARIVRLELIHAIAAIERAFLLSHGSEQEADLARLLEAARATLDLIKETA
ncbi:MAG: hypothetical protein USCAAHI_01209 [Beijerinckiaceae bacterium]|nr:MAG: hypothetical protein USCAAHI_01209 [Beijerinckiaceae bacterium]